MGRPMGGTGRPAPRSRARGVRPRDDGGARVLGVRQATRRPRRNGPRWSGCRPDEPDPDPPTAAPVPDVTGQEGLDAIAAGDRPAPPAFDLALDLKFT